MTDLRITKAGAAQFPMVRHAAEVGWTSMSPKDALVLRGGEAGLLFRSEVESALRRFNPWMTDDAIRSVVENLQALPPTIEGDRQMLAWLRGERQWYDEAEKRHRQVNFDDPSANVLHVTWEWRLKPPAHKGNRAGVPVAIVEHKNPTDADAIERGVTQLRRYERETPELMGAAQLSNVTHLLDHWYGVTWNLSRRYMARWKETQEQGYRFAVQSFFEPTDFLRTLRDWVLFYVEDGETRKTVLRQHKRRAVDCIVERCGLVWHTQGAGKTFTLLTAARLVLERKDEFRTPTVVVVVDRTELEGQLQGWVERLLGEMQQQDIAVWRANSRVELRDLLSTDRRGLIISMIRHREGRQPPRQHPRVHRRGAPLGGQGVGHVPHGRAPQFDHHRVHRHTHRTDGAWRSVGSPRQREGGRVAAARDSTLPPRGFGVYWTLKDVPSLQAAGVSAMEFAEEARPLWAAFPTPTSNDGLGLLCTTHC